MAECLMHGLWMMNTWLPRPEDTRFRIRTILEMTLRAVLAYFGIAITAEDWSLVMTTHTLSSSLSRSGIKDTHATHSGRAGGI